MERAPVDRSAGLVGLGDKHCLGRTYHCQGETEKNQFIVGKDIQGKCYGAKSDELLGKGDEV